MKKSLQKNCQVDSIPPTGTLLQAVKERNATVMYPQEHTTSTVCASCLASLALLPSCHCHHDCYQHVVSISVRARAPGAATVVPAACHGRCSAPRYLILSSAARGLRPRSPHSDSAYCYCLPEGRLNIVVVKEKSYFVKGQCGFFGLANPLMSFPLTRVG